jgi:hypothetical protein
MLFAPVRINRYAIHGMEGIMGKFEGVTTFSLSVRFIRLIRRFLTQEKAYVRYGCLNNMKTGLPVLVFFGAFSLCLLLAGIFGLVTLILLLNTWFMPWVSVFIITAFLLALGLVIGSIGTLMAKNRISDARQFLKKVREDMRWLKKN